MHYMYTLKNRAMGYTVHVLLTTLYYNHVFIIQLLCNSDVCVCVFVVVWGYLVHYDRVYINCNNYYIIYTYMYSTMS